MKTIITIFTLMFYSYAFAANYKAVGTDSKTVYMKKAACENADKARANYKGCFEITGKVVEAQDIETSEVDDHSKPNMKAKYKATACDDPAACLTLMADMGCDEGDYTITEKNTLMPGWTNYCTGILSYEKKTITVLVENPAKKANHEAAEALKATEKAQYAAVMKSMNFGTRMVAMISLRNVVKGLTGQQIIQVVQDYSLINDLLRAGSILTAKVEIESLTPDGTRIVQADKDAILAEINAFLAQ